MIAAVVLAAGASARLGRPKQLVAHRGRTLVRHVVECALGAGCDPVLVVLGARAGAIRPEIEDTAARPVLNERWREGLGSSIRAGIGALQDGWPDARGALLLACDQRRITSGVVRELLGSFRGSDRRIVACAYAGTVGVPAVFDRSLFGELLALEGPTGAKRILQAHGPELVRFPWPDGAFDVDHPPDAKKN